MYELAFFLGTSLAYLLNIWNAVPFIFSLAVPRTAYSFPFAVAFGAALSVMNYGDVERMAEILNIEVMSLGGYMGFTVWGALLAAFVGFAIGWFGRKI